MVSKGNPNPTHPGFGNLKMNCALILLLTSLWIHSGMCLVSWFNSGRDVCEDVGLPFMTHFPFRKFPCLNDLFHVCVISDL